MTDLIIQSDFDDKIIKNLKPYVNMGSELMTQFFNCRDVSKYPNVLKWLVKEYQILPTEQDLLLTYDYSWLEYFNEDEGVEIELWLKEKYDISL